MKKPILLLLFIQLFNIVQAQTDSLTITKQSWKKNRIAKGLVTKHYHFRDCNLFNANQHISVVEVKPKSKLNFDLAYQPSDLLIVDTIAVRNNALAAINGTFFDTKNGGSVDFIKSDDVIINKNRLGKGNTRAGHQKGAILINNYQLSIAEWDGTDDWEAKLKGNDVMVSGPVLRINDVDVKLAKDAFNLARAPRSAIGIKSDGTVLLVAVDGRMIEAEGVTIKELQQIMKWLKCTDAINLDGGGSTTLYAKGKKGGQIVNHPSDNKLFDHAGQRAVANAILLVKPD